jgi:hypothetical protein
MPLSFVAVCTNPLAGGWQGSTCWYPADPFGPRYGSPLERLVPPWVVSPMLRVSRVSCPGSAPERTPGNPPERLSPPLVDDRALSFGAAGAA